MFRLSRSRHPSRWNCRALLFMLPAIVLSAASMAQDDAPLRAIEGEGELRNSERRELQESIDVLHAQTRRMLDEYRAELKIVDGLETYITMLDDQLRAQEAEIATLQTSITDVAVIERQILPLLARMVDGLEQYIALDVPFLPEERSDRIVTLRRTLGRSDVTVAEKARRVFEAFQVETDYGRTIEAYRAKLAIDGASFDADFLRVGRVALVYRTVGDERLGFWNGENWQPLPGSPYRRLIEQGLKVARQEIAPELLTIPLATANVEAP